MTDGTRGVVLIVWGKRGYGFAAYNLAVSLKYHSPEVPITLIAHPKTMEQVPDRSVFDQIIWVDELVTDPGRFKAGIYKYLPYDYNLYLDVDAFCLRPIDPLFDNLIQQGGNYYTFINDVYGADAPNLLPQMYWAWKDDIWDKYKFTQTDKLPATQSSVQFIKKCAESEKLFLLVEKYFDDPIPLDRLRNQWGGTQPDELYLNIALAKTGIAPHIGNDVMWFGNNASIKPRHLSHQYYFLSFFGYKGNIRPVFWAFYDSSLIKMCASRGGNHVFKQQYIKSDKHANKNKNVMRQAPVSRISITEPVTVKRERKPGTIHLFTSYYQTGKSKHDQEITLVMQRNIECESISVIYNLGMEYQHPKVVNIPIDRPTFAQFVSAVNEHPGDYNIIANSDIFFTSEIEDIKEIEFQDTCLALSRYDIKGRGNKLFNYEYSQDTWIFKGPIKQVISCEFVMGLPGCDNRFAHELFQAGYRVINPSLDIKTYHLHEIVNRPYTEADRIHGSYLPVKCEHKAKYLKRKLLIHQPGKVGDILICLPIAKHYSDQGYDVHWMCPAEFHSMFNYVDYAIPVTSRSEGYSKEIDLSFGIIQNTKLHMWWLRNIKSFPSFVNAKYHLAGVELNQRHNLIYNRNEDRENNLFNHLGLTPGERYIIIHDRSDYGTPIRVNSNIRSIYFKPTEDYTVFDWRKVIENAEEIHCIDSSLANFVEVIPVTAKCYFYRVKERQTESLFDFTKWVLIMPGQTVEKEMV